MNNRFRGRNTEKKELKAMAVDSSEFKISQASVWRFFTWSRDALKKTSKLFWKIHLITINGLSRNLAILR